MADLFLLYPFEFSLLVLYTFNQTVHVMDTSFMERFHSDLGIVDKLFSTFVDSSGFKKLRRQYMFFSFINY